MKNLANMILIVFLCLACGRPEPNLQLSTAEAFSFDLGDSWEVNASVNAMGFAQKEIGDEFSLELSYSVDLIVPNSDTLTSVYKDTIQEKDIEEFMDFILEAQVEVDANFGEGDYKLNFHVKDELSGQTKSIDVDFKLSK